MTTEASLVPLNEALPSPVGMDRFRPNIVIGGTEPFAEVCISIYKIKSLSRKVWSWLAMVNFTLWFASLYIGCFHSRDGLSVWDGLFVGQFCVRQILRLNLKMERFEFLINDPPDFIDLFIRQFSRILKMDYPSWTDNPSLLWKRPWQQEGKSRILSCVAVGFLILGTPASFFALFLVMWQYWDKEILWKVVLFMLSQIWENSNIIIADFFTISRAMNCDEPVR